MKFILWHQLHQYVNSAFASNHRQMWSLSQPMTFVVPSIVAVLINNIALGISLRENDCEHFW